MEVHNPAWNLSGLGRRVCSCRACEEVVFPQQGAVWGNQSVSESLSQMEDVCEELANVPKVTLIPTPWEVAWVASILHPSLYSGHLWCDFSVISLKRQLSFLSLWFRFGWVMSEMWCAQRHAATLIHWLSLLLLYLHRKRRLELAWCRRRPGKPSPAAPGIPAKSMLLLISQQPTVSHEFVGPADIRAAQPTRAWITDPQTSELNKCFLFSGTKFYGSLLHSIIMIVDNWYKPLLLLSLFHTQTYTHTNTHSSNWESPISVYRRKAKNDRDKLWG